MPVTAWMTLAPGCGGTLDRILGAAAFARASQAASDYPPLLVSFCGICRNILRELRRLNRKEQCKQKMLETK